MQLLVKGWAFGALGQRFQRGQSILIPAPVTRWDREIHSHLSRVLYEYRVWNHKADCRVRREFGSDGRADIDRLRAAIEERLSSFREWPSS